MPGHFALYMDADVHGPLIKALRKAGWDILRAIDAFPERTPDLTHFEHAVALGRVLVTNDEDQEEIAARWYGEGRPFSGIMSRCGPEPRQSLSARKPAKLGLLQSLKGCAAPEDGAAAEQVPRGDD